MKAANLKYVFLEGNFMYYTMPLIRHIAMIVIVATSSCEKSNIDIKVIGKSLNKGSQNLDGPVVSGVSITNDPTPTWSWTAAQFQNADDSASLENSVTFRYKLNDSDLDINAEQTNVTIFTPESPLADGEHILYVSQSNNGKKWSKPNSFAIVVDSTSPIKPNIQNSVSTVNISKPTWTWVSGGASDSAQIYRYQLDNDDFTQGSTTTTDTIYTPISAIMDGEHTLYVQEGDLAGNWSSTASFTITIDTTSPLPPNVTSTQSFTNDSTPTWTWQTGGGGSANYRYKIDSADLSTGANETSSTTFTSATLADGLHTLYVQEVDLSGNWSNSGSFQVNIDTVPPSAPSVTGTTPTANTTPVWTLTSGAGGSGNFKVRLDNSDLSSGTALLSTGTFIPSGSLSDGTHILYVQERDNAGNWSSTSSFAITIDSSTPTPPTVTGTSPNNSSTPTWTWSSSGGNGSYRYKLDDSSMVSGSTATNLTSFTPSGALSAGNHILYVQESNAVGTWSTTGSFTISIDLTAPSSPTITSTTPTNANTPTWTWSAGSGGNGTFRYELDDSDLSSGATETTSTSFAPSSTISAGNHTLYVQERDAAGNWSNSGSFLVTVDRIAPSAPTVNGDALTNATTPNWSWTSAGDGGSGTYRYKLDDGNLTLGATEVSATSLTPSSALSAGVHVLYVQERDAAGNWSNSGSFSTTIDTTGPGTPSVTGTTPTNDSTPTWSWSSGGSGGNGTFRFKLDNSDLTTGATTTTSTSHTPSSNLSEGNHTLYVEERDDAGNWSGAGSFIIGVDTIAPSSPTVFGSSSTNDHTPTWSWSSGGSGNGTFRYKLDDSNLSSGATTTTNTSFTPSSNISDGNHILYVQETDSAGNWSGSGTYTINIYSLPPALANASAQTLVTTVLMPNLNFVNTGEPVVSCNVSPALPSGLSLTIASSTCRISGTPTASQSATSYTITAASADSSTDTATVDITINTANPPDLANASNQTLVATVAMPSLSFSNSGASATSCSISPALPSGLSLSNVFSSCMISGTPTSSQSATTYTVTATGSDGSIDTATVSITINAASPPNITNAANQSLTQDAAMTTLNFSNSGSAATSCTVSPSLPSGLSISISSSTCSISGTPSTAQSAVSYTVTAVASDGSSDTATVQITISAANHRVFVTSTGTTGALGGIGGADQFCKTQATAAGLSGDWKAILSTSLENASSRIQITSAIYNLNSTPQLVATDSTDFWNGSISNAINYTESGASTSNVYAISASNSSGALTGNTCVDWTSSNGAVSYQMGSSSSTGSTWISGFAGNCSQSYRLYCIDRQKTPNLVYNMRLYAASETSISVYWDDTSINETGFEIYRSTDQTNWTLANTTSANATNYVDTGLTNGTTYYYKMRAVNSYGNSSYNTPVSKAPAKVHRMFITSTTFNGNMGGITGADNSCTSLASGLGGSWKAVLSTSTIDAINRIPINGPVIRVKIPAGEPTVIANNSGDFWDGTLTNTIANNESGTAVSDYSMTATTSSGAKTGSFCSDWTSTGAGGSITMGTSNSTTNWSSGWLANCTQSYRIFCIEQ